MNDLSLIVEALISFMNQGLILYLSGTFLSVFFALRIVKRLVKMLDYL